MHYKKVIIRQPDGESQTYLEAEVHPYNASPGTLVVTGKYLDTAYSWMEVTFKTRIRSWWDPMRYLCGKEESTAWYIHPDNGWVKGEGTRWDPDYGSYGCNREYYYKLVVDVEATTRIVPREWVEVIP